MRLMTRLCAFLLMLCLMLPAASLAADDRDAQFDAALAALMSPAEEGLSTLSYTLRTGENAYVPRIAPAVTPYDEMDTREMPAIRGNFRSADESIVTVDDNGLMTAISAGETTVTYEHIDGTDVYVVTVSDDAMPELIKNYRYVLLREFYSVKRAKLPKYNQYAKWYYGKKNEVGWCSVFTIYCANAAGANPIKKTEVDTQNPPTVQFLREGQVGNQFDGFMDMGRFSGVPKAGYLVIYADMDNAYRTVHIGSVVDVEDRGDGVYAITTVEGNMSNSVKSYGYLYDSKLDNHLVGTEKGLKLQWNMAELAEAERVDPLVQYELHTDHWSVFGFCETWP